MRLSILDQSPVVEGRSAAQAIRETMDLVALAERLGYHRYWFAEHHGSASFASASPEVMMAHAAATTQRMRLGSGGILLGHATPLRVAERLRTLQVVASGRIDAGFGRAPGGDQRVMHALGERPTDAWQRLDAVLELLRDTSVPRSAGAVVAVPDGVQPPDVWILGTSPDSAVQAARRGLRYAFGSFIDPTHVDAALAAYHSNFEPSPWCARPTTLVATVVFAAETEAEARAMARSSERWFVEAFLRGRNVRFPVVDGDHLADASSMERMVVDMRRATVLIGAATDVAERLQALSRRYATNEFAVVTISDDHAMRSASYTALAEAIGPVLTSDVG